MLGVVGGRKPPIRSASGIRPLPRSRRRAITPASLSGNPGRWLDLGLEVRLGA